MKMMRRWSRKKLKDAIEKNDIATASSLISNGSMNLNDCSLLSIVVQHDRDERFVTLLLDAGAPLDGLSNDDLMTLVKSVAVLNRLLARGVNFTTMRDDDGRNLCHHVVRNIASEHDIHLLADACGRNDAIHAVDNHGMTALHLASFYNNDSAMRALVELGADIDRQDDAGWTALVNAAANVHSPCVELLLALGAEVRLVVNDGRTACHLAASAASLCLLVAVGGDLDQPDNNGETPRMIATRKNVALPTADEIDAASRRIAKTRLDLVRERAFQICVGLHPFEINALQLCEILMHSFGAIGSVIKFHQWWAIAIKVKHFRDQ
jgi:ankyrin repeat protein